MSSNNQELKSIIRQLQDSFNQTLDALYDLPPDYLNEPCGHGCARGGTARDLLVHNIFHEKQHTGQIHSIRDQLRLLPGWNKQDLYLLLADYYASRASLITALFGLTDEQLDAQPKDNGWTVRQTLDHVLYWDRNSIDQLKKEQAQSDQTAGIVPLPS